MKTFEEYFFEKFGYSNKDGFLYKNAEECWDYCMKEIEILKEHGECVSKHYCMYNKAALLLVDQEYYICKWCQGLEKVEKLMRSRNENKN